MKRPGPRTYVLLAVLLGWALRVFRLGYQELRGDEAFGYFFQQPGYGQILRDTIALQEPHPVGSYFVQKIWLAGAGTTEFALRFSSAWFSALSIALIYRLGRRLLLPHLASGLAAVLLALSPYVIWHSQDARMYSMLLALIIASGWLGLEGLARGKAGYWAAYVAVTWLALHTHYSAAFVVVAQNLAVFGWALHGRHFRPLRDWILSQVILAALYAPWLWLAGRNLSAYSGNGESPGLPAMVYRSFSALAVGQAIPTAAQLWLAMLAGAIIVSGLMLLARRRDLAFAAWWLGLSLLVPLGATWLTALDRPIFNERYLVSAVPAFCLLLAAGLGLPLDALRRPARRQAAVRGTAYVYGAALLLLAGTMLLSLGNHYANPAYSKTNGWRAVGAALRRMTAGIPPAEVRVAENFPDPTLWYYYTGPVEHVVLPPAARDTAGASREVAAMAANGVRRVVLPVLDAGEWDPDGAASAALSEQFTLVAREQAGDWPLEVYARPDPGTLQPVGATFSNGAVLERAAVEPGDAQPGGVAVVHLNWGGQATGLTGTEKLFIHVANAQGVPVAQADPAFGSAQLGSISSYGIRLPADMPSGQYQVLAGLYDPGQPGAPRVRTSGGQDRVKIGQLVAGEN